MHYGVRFAERRMHIRWLFQRPALFGSVKEVVMARAVRRDNVVEMPPSKTAGGSRSTGRRRTVDDGEIARRAYELYESRGGGDGADLDDWLQAERELHAGSATQRTGISNRESAIEEAEERDEYPSLDTESPAPQDAAGRVGEQPLSATRDRQTSHKAGSRSIAQKQAGSRYPDSSMPASRKVAGAFGKEPTGSAERKSKTGVPNPD
jgi:hypothetical protein